jgi:hypothetical protein
MAIQPVNMFPQIPPDNSLQSFNRHRGEKMLTFIQLIPHQRYCVSRHPALLSQPHLQASRFPCQLCHQGPRNSDHVGLLDEGTLPPSPILCINICRCSFPTGGWGVRTKSQSSKVFSYRRKDGHEIHSMFAHPSVSEDT